MSGKNCSFYILFISTILSGCTSSGVSFNPDFYLGDSKNAQIVGEGNRIVKANDPLFDKYACMFETKVYELRQILRNIGNAKSQLNDVYNTLDTEEQKEHFRAAMADLTRSEKYLTNTYWKLRQNSQE